MLDLSHIPNSQQDVRIFNANGSAWQTWQKPRKCNYVYIMCIGGAGGGAGGGSSVYAPGGASAGISRALYNAQQLPDSLYIQVGLGGAGGTWATAGSPGTRSLVALQPVIITQSMVLVSGNAAALGGRVTGANAAGETPPVQTSATFLSLSTFIGTAGVTSIASNVSPAPPNITPFTSQIVTPGGGGGGGGLNNGASILSTTISPLIVGGLASSSGNGENGADGITSYKPFYSLGGAGGGSSSVANGGNGGNGGIGAGGGGGAGGSSGVNGGTGGKGGDGIVIIISF